jgi:hypothetical protein
LFPNDESVEGLKKRSNRDILYTYDKNNVHQLYLMCDDLSATIKELKGQGIGCDEPSEQSWGITTQIHLPGGDRLGLYQPKHPTAFSSKGEI